jgi:hypothetical protein
MRKVEDLRKEVAEMLDCCLLEDSLRGERKKEETAKMEAALIAGDGDAYAKAQTEINRLDYNDVAQRGFIHALSWVLIRIDAMKGMER